MALNFSIEDLFVQLYPVKRKAREELEKREGEAVGREKGRSKSRHDVGPVGSDIRQL